MFYSKGNRPEMKKPLSPVYLPAQLSAFSRSTRETYLAGTYISIARIPTFSGRDACMVGIGPKPNALAT